MHGASRSNTNDIVSRPLRGGGANEVWRLAYWNEWDSKCCLTGRSLSRSVDAQAQSAATEMDMDAEDDYGEQVSYRQVLQPLCCVHDFTACIYIFLAHIGSWWCTSLIISSLSLV